MHRTDWYDLIDEVMLREADRVVTVHRLSEDDPFFRDHFPGRPVLPGVLATEALLQAGRALLGDRTPGGHRWVLGSARAIRFSRFLEPGQWLACDVRLMQLDGQEAKLAVSGFACQERPTEPSVLEGLAAAVSGRVVLRAVRLG